jgi:hypothetical protein
LQLQEFQFQFQALLVLVFLIKTLTMETSKAMEESDVGILCYISQLPGFRGILKQRQVIPQIPQPHKHTINVQV